MKKNIDSQVRFAELIGEVKPIRKQENQLLKQSENKKQYHLKKEAQNRRCPSNKTSNFVNENFSNLNSESLSPLSNKYYSYHTTIDLHGLLINEALNFLEDKLNFRKNRQLNYWLIIHGKGKNSPEYDKAPLKHAIIHLLYQHPAVAAMRSIQDTSFESGAIAIAVHRSKSP